MVDTVIRYLIGGVIGYCIGITLFPPLIDKVYSWWAARTIKPFFDEPVKERMEETAELMLESVRESRERKGGEKER